MTEHKISAEGNMTLTVYQSVHGFVTLSANVGPSYTSILMKADTAESLARSLMEMVEASKSAEAA